MISAFIAMALISAGHSKWPDPYIGMSGRIFPAHYAGELNTTTNKRTSVKRHQRFITLGVPFELKNLSGGEVHNYRLIAVPEIMFNDTSFMFNGCVGLTQDVDFQNYRAWPLGYFWETSLGIHYGYLTDPRDYDRSEHDYVGKSLRLIDRTSIAAIMKIAFGPRFAISDSMNLKLRVGMDWAYGQLGLFMMRSSFSDNIGAAWGIQAQIDFK